MHTPSKVLAGLATIACGFIAFPLSVSAGGASQWIPDPYDVEGSPFIFDDGDDTAEGATLVGHPRECVTVDINGTSEVRFTVTIDAKESYTPVGGSLTSIEDLGDLLDCYTPFFAGSASMLISAVDYSTWEPMAYVLWIDLLNGEPLFYDCLGVKASDGGNDQVDSIVGFPEGMGDTSIESLDDVQAADYPGLSWGSGRFHNSPTFFGLVLFDDSDLTDTDLTWDFEFTVSACGGVETPRIDLDHYRRRAELDETSALPDTL